MIEDLTEGLRFELQAECPATGARAGVLHTVHGTIETPVFMPVGTQGTVKALTPAQLQDDLDAKIILANTYHLYLRPGHELIRDFGGFVAAAGRKPLAEEAPPLLSPRLRATGTIPQRAASSPAAAITANHRAARRT